MDGQIWIESELGEGASFIFEIKVGIGDEAGISENASLESDEKRDILKGKSILIAEDIDINREILMMLLEGTGLEIDQATNGQEGYDRLIANPDAYDIILMDIQMPVLDGLETTRRIRALPNRPQRKGRIPIIALTANIFKDDIENCLAAGMDGHLGKPFDMDKVMEVLQKYIC